MIKAAVGTHSELLAAASPCRQTSCESMEPMACLLSSGQVVIREAGQEKCHLPTGCCRDCGTHRATTLPGGGRELQSFVLNPPSQNTCRAAAQAGQKLTAAGLGTIYPLSRGSEVGDAMKCPSLSTALPRCCPSQGGSDPRLPTGSQCCSYPDVPGSAVSKSRANFCTRERLGSFLAAEVP